MGVAARSLESKVDPTRRRGRQPSLGARLYFQVPTQL